ncbi:hypothetical protein [Photobacterium rosenbergii]|uniref:hypothetical protein n=1 Tax=Photobacterium rosenbergii TaxID=294936 RepID=UPI001C99E24D|nr:hypothetical protein [Photobacterium rosenbergii]MBY5944078.1 hypothetical protein [Photobacterium rosenbergii]
MAYVIVLGTVFTLTLLARNHIMTNRKIKDFVFDIEQNHLFGKFCPDTTTYNAFKTKDEHVYTVIGYQQIEESAYIAEVCLATQSLKRLSTITNETALNVIGNASIHQLCQFWKSDFFDHVVRLNMIQIKNSSPKHFAIGN